MKKNYEAPELSLVALTAGDFLSTSGDALGKDPYDDPYGNSF